MVVKRIVYLFCLALVIGLVLVNFRTRHIQAVNRMFDLAEQEQQLRQELWKQQMQLSGALESPGWIKRRIEELKLEVSPLGAWEN